MTHKRLNGQFFTTNSEHILQGFSKYIKNKEVIDPFAGNRDLIIWAKNNKCKNITGFDCDKNYVDNKEVFYNDSINFPKDYNFILTNPPYLHKNKATKEIKDRYFKGINSKFEDLYQASINSILDSEEGILIVPLNFLSAENAKKIREIFFNKFKIVSLNVFKEKVFEDTTYNVISFYFKKKKKNIEKNEISAIIFPEKKKINFTIEKKFDWQLGGNFLNEVRNTKNHLGVTRLTKNLLGRGDKNVKLAVQNIKYVNNFRIDQNTKKILKNNILFLRAIDSKNGKKIQLENIRDYNILGLVGKNSSRNMAHLIFKKEVSQKEQRELMEEFNKKLNTNRERYFSFFLTNFRDNGRKRISFNFVYKFLNYLYDQKYSRQSILF